MVTIRVNGKDRGSVNWYPGADVGAMVKAFDGKGDVVNDDNVKSIAVNGQKAFHFGEEVKDGDCIAITLK